jgi:hypothetical protein
MKFHGKPRPHERFMSACAAGIRRILPLAAGTSLVDVTFPASSPAGTASLTWQDC